MDDFKVTTFKRLEKQMIELAGRFTDLYLDDKTKETFGIKEKRIFQKEYGIEKIIRYDENGNEVYHKDAHGETWTTYNELGKITNKRSKDDEGNETWSKYEYNEKGNEIHFEDSDGNVRETRYDEKGNIVYSRDDDKEFFYEHDEERNEIVYEDAAKTQKVAMYDGKYGDLLYSKVKGKETWSTYDAFGNVIKERSKDAESNEYWAERECDEKGNVTKFRDSLGEEFSCEYEYDEAGHVISFKDSKGNFEESRFDAHGNISYFKDNNYEDVYERKYDDKGNMIYEKCTSDGFVTERWLEYDAYGNLTLHKDSDFGETIISYIYYPE